MEMVVSEEVWKNLDNDELVFDHILLIVRPGSRYLFARQRDRHAPIDATKLHLEEIPDSLPSNSYVKRPNLLDYGEKENCCTVLLQESEINEILRQHPHPNIAQYYGCVVENGRFGGLCLQGYSSTCKQRAERRASKGQDGSGEPALSETEKRRLMQGIRDGVTHLHRLGLVHNDLNPSNIMLEDGVAVIIDFDSCRRQGEPMGD